MICWQAQQIGHRKVDRIQQFHPVLSSSVPPQFFEPEQPLWQVELRRARGRRWCRVIHDLRISIASGVFMKTTPHKNSPIPISTKRERQATGGQKAYSRELPIQRVAIAVRLPPTGWLGPASAPVWRVQSIVD
jgi:hypothetical protein